MPRDDLDEIESRKAAERKFAEELCGISPGEVTGLLAKVMRKEFHIHTTRNGGKRVRKWKGNLLGINIEVTEVDTGSQIIPVMGFFDRMTPVDYHVENVEWEFRVSISGERSYVRDGAPSGKAKLGPHPVIVSYPWFEGDEDTYRSDLSLIRLMGLNNEEEDAKEVMV
jgi:hypothetical protein